MQTSQGKGCRGLLMGPIKITTWTPTASGATIKRARHTLTRLDQLHTEPSHPGWLFLLVPAGSRAATGKGTRENPSVHLVRFVLR